MPSDERSINGLACPLITSSHMLITTDNSPLSSLTSMNSTCIERLNVCNIYVKIFHLHFTFYKVDMIVGVVLSFFLQDSVATDLAL